MNSKEKSALDYVKNVKEDNFWQVLSYLFPEMIALLLVLTVVCIVLIGIFIGGLPCTTSI